MAILRSIGSSLVAKSSPGSASREAAQKRIEKPEVPQKGAPGSLQRQFTEEPFVNQTVPGSQKVVSVAPEAEAASSATPNSSLSPEVAGLLSGVVGQPVGNVPGSTPGANNQALFTAPGSAVARPSVSAAAPTARGGKAATAVSSGAAPKAGAAFAYSPQAEYDLGFLGDGGVSNVQAETPQPSRAGGQPSASALGGGAALVTGGSKGGKNVVSQAGQIIKGIAAGAIPFLEGIAPAAARALGPIGLAASIPAAGAAHEAVFGTPSRPSDFTPGGPTGREAGGSAQIRGQSPTPVQQTRTPAVAPNPQVRQAVTNVQRAVQPVVQKVSQAASPVLRSVTQAASNVGNNLRSVAQKASSFISNLFGKKR